MLVEATNMANGSSFSWLISPRCIIFLICFMRFLRWLFHAQTPMVAAPSVSLMPLGVYWEEWSTTRKRP